MPVAVVGEVDDDAALAAAAATEVDVAQHVLRVAGTRFGEALHDLRARILLVGLVEQRDQHGVALDASSGTSADGSG